MFSVERQGISPFTSPENTQIRTEEPKSPSRGISDKSPSLQGSGPLHCDYGENQRDPSTDDSPRVSPTAARTQEVPHPSPRLNPPGGKLALPKILTDTRLESDGPGTPFYTPGGSFEVSDRKPFDSAVVVYPMPSPRFRNAASPTRKVADVRNPTNKWQPEYEFPTQSPRSATRAAEDGPRRGLRMPFTQPSQVTGGHQRDSASSFSISPFEEFRGDGNPYRCISEVTTPTTSWRASASSPMPGFSAGDSENGIRGGTGVSPLSQGKRKSPKIDRSENGREERRKEKDDNSRLSALTDYISIPSEVEGRQPQGLECSTPVGPTRSGILRATH